MLLLEITFGLNTDLASVFLIGILLSAILTLLLRLIIPARKANKMPVVETTQKTKEIPQNKIVEKLPEPEVIAEIEKENEEEVY